MLAAQALARLPPRIDRRLADLGRSLDGTTASERVLLSRIALAQAALGERVDAVLDLALRSLKDEQLDLERPELFSGLRPPMC